jgi:hypothetical protein
MWNSKSFVAVACFLPGRAKDLSAPLYSKYVQKFTEPKIVYFYDTREQNVTEGYISLAWSLSETSDVAKQLSCKLKWGRKERSHVSHTQAVYTVCTP